MLADQMSEHLRVGGGAKLVSGLQEPFLDAVEILDHAVMDDSDAAALVEVGVGVLVRRRAVGGPTRVADPESAGGRLSLEHPAEPFVDPAFSFACLERGAVQDAHPGAVVTAVLEPAQSLKQDGRRLLFADVAYDAAHKSGPR